MGNTETTRPPWSVAEVLRTGRLPENFIGVLLARFLVMEANRAFLATELWKGGGIHAFLGSLTAEASAVPSLAGLTLLWDNRYGEDHILHSFFSVPVGPYNLERWLFGCREELPPERLPVIT